MSYHHMLYIYRRSIYIQAVSIAVCQSSLMSKSKPLHVNVLAGRILDSILLQGPSGVLLQLLLIHRPFAKFCEGDSLEQL